MLIKATATHFFFHYFAKYITYSTLDGTLNKAKILLKAYERH